MADHQQHERDSPTADSEASRRVTKRTRGGHVVVDNPKQLAAMFASMVTVPASENEWIARNGDESLFKVLQQMMPEVQQ
jgi:hypothetical protein